MITIVTASWGNDEETAAIVNTIERGHKAISARHTPQEWSDFLIWRAGGGLVRARKDGTAYKLEQAKKAERDSLAASATQKLEKLGISVDELRAITQQSA